MKKLYYSVFCLIILSNLDAQMQTAHWFFGHNAGVDFSSGIPVADTNGQINTNEGCTSISDEYGNLLFYTEGKKVYDRTHNIMENGTGLRGDPSSTSSAIILPKPDDCNLYYIFTIDVQDGEVPFYRPKRGLEYNIVDMSLNGGLGAVVQKNIEIPINGQQQGYEKLAAISNADKTGYWVLTHFEGNFYAFSITAEGVNMEPVISSTAIYGGVPTAGYLKGSPDGTKLSMTVSNPNEISTLSLYDFDNSTGIVSHEIIIDSTEEDSEEWIFDEFYGIEFSEENNILYAGKGWISGVYHYQIIQYNLLATPIIDSKYIIVEDIGAPGALQRGLDGKIYFPKAYSEYLSRIENPNTLYNPSTGEAPVYTDNAVYLGGKESHIGLPTFLNHYFRIAITVNDLSIQEDQQYCTGFLLDFDYCHQGGEIESIHWDFGDGEESTEMYPQHYYNAPGIFIITLTLIVDGEEYIRTFEITITGPPSVEDAEQSVCLYAGEEHTFNLEDSLDEINTENGDYTITFHLTETEAENGENPQPTNYTTDETTTIWVRVEDENGCFVIRELNLIINEIPEIEITSPIEICINQTATLEITTASENTINWYANETDTIPVFTGNPYITPELTETTSYWVEAVSEEGCMSERQEITVEITESPEITIENPVEICYGNTATLNAQTSAETVNWYANETDTTPVFTGNPYTTPELTVDTTYWVEASGGIGCTSQRIPVEITIVAIPELTLPVLPEICSGESISITVSTTNGTVNWYENELDITPIFNGTTYTIQPETTTTLWVEAVDGDCKSAKESITITVNELPTITAEPSDPVCVGNQVELSVESNGMIINWYENELDETPIFTGNPFTTPELTETTSYWVEAINEEGCKTERIAILAEITDQIIPEFTQVEPQCAGTEFQLLDTSDNGITGYWTPEINNMETTTYTFHPDLGQCASENVEMTIQIVEIPELEFPAEEDLISCIAQTITITIGTIGETVYWYANETDGTPFHTGTSYTTPPLNTTTTYYVEAQTGNCKSEREPITITVYPTPEMQEMEDLVICDGDSYEFWAPEGFDYYEWKDQSGTIISTEAEVIFTEEGTYQLIAGINGIPCPVYRNLTVSFSTTPTITEIKSTESTLTIYVTGDGPFEYSLDQVFWQSTNTFYNLEPGIYYVYVRDLTGCGSGAKQGAIMGVPNFISPNGDGKNDTWKIRALEAFPNTRLQIFDRYGKMFVDRILQSDFEWNGKYNGEALPGGSYWYILSLESGEKLGGHINIRNY